MVTRKNSSCFNLKKKGEREWVILKLKKGVFPEEICGFNSSYKIDSTIEGCTFFINIPKVLPICNVGLFLNTLPHVQVGIFFCPCYRVSSVCPIRPVIGFDSMKKFMGLTYLIKPV